MSFEDKNYSFSGKRKEKGVSSYNEELIKCESSDKCEYKTKIKVKIGNNQRILLLLRHLNEEYYLILHQHKLIIGYPMIYRKIAPERSTYHYKAFYEKGDDTYENQNKRGKDRCEGYKFNDQDRLSIPIFEDFNDKTFSICCSCADTPITFESNSTIYGGLPRNMRLQCINDNETNRKLYKERIVSVKKSIRHLLPFYAIFRFMSDVKIFIIFHINIIKKEKDFSTYYKLYEEKKNNLNNNISYRYVLDDSKKEIKLFDEKIFNISSSSSAFDNINIPSIYNNYLLYPFFPDELYNIKYDTLEYGCSYNKALKFECIENDEKKCEYTDSTCLKKSILIPITYVSDKNDVCGLIGYNDVSIWKNENCLENIKCIKNTVESYLNTAQEITKGNEEILTKLPIINGKYPHYIFKKKNYDIKSSINKRSIQFFTDTNIDHYIAYEYYKEDRTEFILTIINEKNNSHQETQSLEMKKFKGKNEDYMGHTNDPYNQHGQHNNGQHGQHNNGQHGQHNNGQHDKHNNGQHDKHNNGQHDKHNNAQHDEHNKMHRINSDRNKNDYIPSSYLHTIYKTFSEHINRNNGNIYDDEKKNLYDGTVFYIETLNELRIINILFSDSCNELNTDTCGVLVHIWNPSKEAIKGRLKLQCFINKEDKYTDEKNLVYEQGVYHFLFFFKVPLETFLSFRNCTVHAYGAFQLYDMQTYINYKKSFFRRFFYHQPKEINGIELYAQGIKKFICCQEDIHICKIKNIPQCNTKESLNLISVFISILILSLIILIYFTGYKKKKNTNTQENLQSTQNVSLNQNGTS
ncbi:conserved Plasmodium protein, unknown function [Plasmodium reichenowi]|uniref:Uncharacterized protein n=1 Tax=Plasmodium reichenowi TaxID=5854 RepID=A0A060RTU9_PLARE|nr:conserved Plasmodium protein, unknown function [Plasmodium reichenowi]